MTNQPSTPVDLLIEGGIVLTMDPQRRVYAPGHVGVRDGRVVAVSSTASDFAAGERIDASEMLVMPGLINAHNHLDQCLYRSCFNEENPPGSFWHMALGLTRERARAGASLSLLELAHYGVTTTQESHFTHHHMDSTDGVCDAVLQSGMRAVIARGFSDGQEMAEPFRERPEVALQDLDRLEAEYDSDRILINSEASKSLRCTPDGILAMVGWARERGKLWHMHLGHHREELADALQTVGMGTVQYVDSLGVLGPDLLAVHCTRTGLLQDELALLGSRQVRIAHCPDQALRTGNEPPPIWDLEELGARVAICVDGSNSNNGQNIWQAMKLAVYLQRSQFGDRYLGTAEQALEMVTIGAAAILDMDDRVGSLEPGKQADIALFRRDQLHLVPDAMLVSNLVYSGVSTKADTVLVGGRVVLRHGRSTVFDEVEVVARAREAQAAMIQEAGYGDKVGLSVSWPVIKPLVSGKSLR
jgi:5-methylthioadenosine/S-adenosylhomocysteine deaminase